MNLSEYLRSNTIKELDLPENILNKLQEQNCTDLLKIHSALQAYKVFGKCTIKGLSIEEIDLLNQRHNALLQSNGLMRTPTQQTSVPPIPPALIKPASRKKPSDHRTEDTQRGFRTEEELDADRIRTYQDRMLSELTSSLVDWEKRLVPKVRTVELIGEVAVSKEELDDIALYMGKLFKSYSEETVLNLIKRHFPATFLVLMVGLGIYGYDQGDFWPAYEKALKRSIDHSAFGQLFEKLLDWFGKPKFRDLQRKSLRYVSLVLAHGGIPVYCLKDFFSNIVLNCAIRPQLLALEGQELVDEVLKHSSYTANTDRPILYFLEFGGKTAANLLDRSRRMLLAWQQRQYLLSAEEAGLPPHITTFFAAWVRENPTLVAERGTRTRLKRPQLSLDPWGLGLFLLLPSQPISALLTSNVSWEVKANKYQEVLRARTQRKGDQVETREITVRLNEFPESIQVHYVQDDHQYEWKIKGFSADMPVLAFDPINGQLQNHIFARETWLLYPQSMTLSVLDGTGELLEILPDLPGEMSQFRLECWDLTQTFRLGLTREENRVQEIFVRSQEEIQKPYLDRGRILRTDIEDSTAAIYVGPPRNLCVPLSRHSDVHTELNRWKIKVQNLGPTDHEITTEVVLSDLDATVCTVAGGTAYIHLDSEELLGKRPVGIYEIFVKGPLGTDATLHLNILPELKIQGIKNLYVPNPSTGAENAHFTVQGSLLDEVDVLNAADGIKIEHSSSGFHDVLVPAAISLAELAIRRPTIRHEYLRISLPIRINRLRWRLVKDDGLVENWAQKHLTMLVQELLQEKSPLLIIDLPAPEDNVYGLELHVRDIEGRLIQCLKTSDRPSKRSHRFWRFDLSLIKHILGTSDSSVIHLDLVGTSTAKETKFDLPVLILTREIKLSQIKTETYTSTEHHHILVNWKEQKRLRSRAFILWSLFRPWQQPIQISIPDNADGEHEFVIDRKELSGGRYRVQMVVVDPWVSTPLPPTPPPADTWGCFDVELSSPHELLKHIEQRLRAPAKPGVSNFSSHIEASIISRHIEDEQAAYRHLTVCCQNLVPATSRELLILRSLLASTNSSFFDKELSSQLMHPSILSRLLEDLKADRIELWELKTLLKSLPPYKEWSPDICEILVQIDDPKIRTQALVQLVSEDVSRAVTWILNLLEKASLSVADAVELLYEEKPLAMEQMRKKPDAPMVKRLLDLLSRYNADSGLPMVQPGSWLLTNAGWGRIEQITDPRTNISVDSFIEGEGKYLISVRLNINETYDLSGEKALINMATNEIIFPKANRVFICQKCQSFASARLDIFKQHMSSMHESSISHPGNPKGVIPLTSIQFNMNPKHRTSEV